LADGRDPSTGLNQVLPLQASPPVIFTETDCESDIAEEGMINNLIGPCDPIDQQGFSRLQTIRQLLPASVEPGNPTWPVVSHRHNLDFPTSAGGCYAGCRPPFLQVQDVKRFIDIMSITN
jgi:hypothetical protein